MTRISILTCSNATGDLGVNHLPKRYAVALTLREYKGLPVAV